MTKGNQIIPILRALSKLKIELQATDTKLTFEHFERYLNLTDVLVAELYAKYGTRTTDGSKGDTL